MRSAPGVLRRLRALRRHVRRRAVSTSASGHASSPALCAEQAALHGFSIVRREQIAELASEATLYRHKATGAEVMSLTNDDPNKVFGALFRTPPSDSTGVAHILEHSVLCGSRDYPLKEPFVELLKGSQQTFLNAMTYPDRTVYPVASCNISDFYNLVDVYLNAVFFPRAVDPEHGPLILAQEGWHFEGTEDGLICSGVVYNEMKGVYSSPDSVLWKVAQEALFPNTCYGVDSGGDPVVIPDLTFQQFRETHAEWYHPSNGYFWFAGNDDPLERLALLQRYFDQFAPRQPRTTVETQQFFQKPRVVRESYEVSADDGVGMDNLDMAAIQEQLAGLSEEEAAEAMAEMAGSMEQSQGKAMVLVSWLLKEEKVSFEEALAFEVLSTCLVGTPAAPLYKALTDSGLGSAVIGGGYDDELLQPTFSIGLKGVAERDEAALTAVQSTILATLEKHAEVGFDNSLVEATLNTFEFTLRENNTGSMPRGLVYLLRASGTWVHSDKAAEGQELFEALRFEDRLAQLKQKLCAGEPVLQRMIRKFLINNNHRVTVELLPDASVGKMREDRERKWLMQMQSELGPDVVAQVIEDAERLKHIQQTPDSAETLAMVPHLSLADMPRQGTEIPTTLIDTSQLFLDEVAGTGQQLPWLLHSLPTAGIVYVDMAFDLSNVAAVDVRTPCPVASDCLVRIMCRLSLVSVLNANEVSEVPLLSLWCRCQQQMGLDTGEDFVELAQRIGAKTGGISASIVNSSIRGKPLLPQAHLILRGKAMGSQAHELANIMSDLLNRVDFDNQERFKTLVGESLADMEAAALGSGHSLCITRLAAQHDLSGWLDEQLGGVSALEYLRNLNNTLQIEGGWATVLSQLRRIQDTVIQRNGLTINVTADENADRLAAPALAQLVHSIPNTRSRTDKKFNWGSMLSPDHEGFTIPTQVNYVAKGGTCKVPERLYGCGIVLSKLLGTTWLWDRVRVVGGAYGVFGVYDWRRDTFCYVSYRDPKLVETLETYDSTAEFVAGLDLDEGGLEKAIVSTIGDLDAPMLPDAQGFTALMQHLRGETAAERQMRRDQILSTSREDFFEFSKALQQVAQTGTITVVGSQQALDEYEPGFAAVTKLL